MKAAQKKCHQSSFVNRCANLHKLNPELETATDDLSKLVVESIELGKSVTDLMVNLPHLRLVRTEKRRMGQETPSTLLLRIIRAFHIIQQQRMIIDQLIRDGMNGRQLQPNRTVTSRSVSKPKLITS